MNFPNRYEALGLALRLYPTRHIILHNDLSKTDKKEHYVSIRCRCHPIIIEPK